MARSALPPQRILVIHYRYIGDTLLVVPFLRNLRQAHPEAHIVWVLGPGDADVVKGIPYIDEFLVWDPRKARDGRPARHAKLADKIKFVLALRKRRFDKVYVLKRSFSSALLGAVSGARERIGFDTQHRGLLLTRRVPYRSDQHEVENLLDVLRADGIAPHDKHLETWLSREERAAAEDFLARKGIRPTEKIIGFHPYATNEPRAWHEDDFAAVGNEVQRKYGARILIFGSKLDRVNAERLQSKMHPPAINAAGETDLRGTIALVARCSLLVCNDSGIMHLGAALGIPLVALFGPGSPNRFGPWTKNAKIIYHAFPCSPCRQKYFRDCTPSGRQKPPCMEAISTRQVLDAVEATGVFPSTAT